MPRFPFSTRQGLARGVFISLALVIATVGVYLPVRHHGFVNLDDDVFVTDNPNIGGGLTWQSVRWVFTAGSTHKDPNTDYWRPLSLLSHVLDIELFGLRPAGHHLMNVGLHAAAAVALFLVLQSMTNAPWRSAFVAALFALHPLRVESVAWVAERKDVLSGLFFMLALGAYTRYVRRPFSLRGYLMVLFLFALGLMSKTMVATLPFVLLLLDYWPLGRTKWAKPEAGEPANVPPSRLLMEKLPFFALAIAAGATTFLGHRDVGSNLLSVPLGIRISNALLSYAVYIGRMFWPTGLAVFYPLQVNLSQTTAMLAGVGLVAVTVTVMWQARRRPWLVTGWLWYLGMLVPVIGVFQCSGEAMADRFPYLPMVGLFVALCWSVPSRLVERQNPRVITCVAAGALLAACAALSRVQVEYWRDSETLFRHALDVTRNNWLAHNNLGNALMRSDRMTEGIGHVEQALRIKPDYAEAHNNLGYALMGLGRMPEGIEHLEQALSINPDYAEAHNNLGVALMGSGRMPEAIGHLERALRIKPDFAEAHCNLGIAVGQIGRVGEAIGHLEQALRIKPDLAQAHNSLGNALMRTGRISEAIGHYDHALRIKPNFAEAHNNLGYALMGLGRMPEAIEHLEHALRIKPDYAEADYNLGAVVERGGRLQDAIGHYEQALRIKPDYPEAQNNLAWLLATLEPAEGADPARAVPLAERACKLTGDRVAPYLDTLAAAYAATGRFTDATATAQKAIEVARSSGQKQVADEIEAHLQLYREGRAYHRLQAAR